MKQPLNKLAREYRETGSKDIFSSARDNFIYGFVGAVLVVFIATEIDIAVLI